MTEVPARETTSPSMAHGSLRFLVSAGSSEGSAYIQDVNTPTTPNGLSMSARELFGAEGNSSLGARCVRSSGSWCPRNPAASGMLRWCPAAPPPPAPRSRAPWREREEGWEWVVIKQERWSEFQKFTSPRACSIGARNRCKRHLLPCGARMGDTRDSDHRGRRPGQVLKTCAPERLGDSPWIVLGLTGSVSRPNLSGSRASRPRNAWG